MQRDGGWLFISHSHQDVALVRRIRNKFESLGFEPLMFFLKSLDDDDEIDDLICREIDAREWFVYVDSPTARESRWVRTEREHVAGLSGKKVFTINLEESLDEQVERIARQLKVYVSYSHVDRGIVAKIRGALIMRDFLVWTDEDLDPGEDWRHQIDAHMADSARNGFAIVIISSATVASESVFDEIGRLVELRSKIVPVYVDDPPLLEGLRVLIGDLQGVHISRRCSEEEVEEVVSSIVHRVEYYSSDFRDSCGYRGAISIVLPPIGTIDNLTFWDCPALEEVVVPNSVSFISDDAFEGHEDVVVKCRKGSYASRWCQEHGHPYQLID